GGNRGGRGAPPPAARPPAAAPHHAKPAPASAKPAPSHAPRQDAQRGSGSGNPHRQAARLTQPPKR
ncbi:MAG TPA: hypothetical protein VIO33_20490, partial [Burkholderiaceae bacterium]